MLNIVSSHSWLAKIEYALGNVEEAKKQAGIVYEIYAKLARKDRMQEEEELKELI
jgi:hypothetical protein